jgi:cytochrome c biogenesis protein CcdA
MRGINYLAGFGTVFIFVGIFCIKAIFPKEIIRENNEYVTTTRMKNYQKAMLLLMGVLCIAGGCLLLVKSIKDV